MRLRDDFVAVKVPATSANLGPGFDCMGLALDLWDEVSVHATTGPTSVVVEGEGAGNVEQGEDNLVVRALRLALDRVGAPQVGVRMHCTNRIPHSRGLGSSASAIVAGVTLARALIGDADVLGRQEILEIGSHMEGHPDNVAPAIFGGFTVNTVTNGHVECFSFLPRIFMRFVVMVPDFYLSTKSAREVLPSEVPMKDAVFNVSHAAMMVAALARGSEKHLGNAFEDALHQNYRASLIPGMFDVFAAAKKAGAYGAVLSGAGPCLIAFVPEHRKCTEEVAAAMQEAFRAHDVEARPLHLRLDTKGARVLHRKESSVKKK